MSLDPDSLVEELATSPAAPADHFPAVRRQTLQKVRYTHEDCIDRILSDPTISQNELAAIYGYSPGWMSIAINSDAFQAALAARRQELIDPVLRASLNDHMKAVATQSFRILAEKLAQPAAAVPDALALQAAALGAKCLGYGLPQGIAQAPAAPASEHLKMIAERLTSLHRKINGQPDVVDVTARELPQGA